MIRGVVGFNVSVEGTPAVSFMFIRIRLMKGWPFESASNDRRQRPRNDYSVLGEEIIPRRNVAAVYYRHHQANDKELRVAEDDHGTLADIDESFTKYYTGKDWERVKGN